MSFFTLKNGERLYYEDTGSGDQTLVMLHGWTSTHEVFESLVPELSKAARVIIYDHRGHGRSKDANSLPVTMDTLSSDLNELITGLGLENITLLGWSMGAGVVMDYTGIYGCGKLRQIILCDMTPRQMNDDTWKLGLYKGEYNKEHMDEEAGKDFYQLYKEFARAAIPKLVFVPSLLLRPSLKENLAKCDEGVLRSLSRSMKEKDFRPCIDQISVPVTYFYAKPGTLFSEDLADWYKDHIHSSFRAVPFEKSSHMLPSDQPEKFAREVMKTLQA